MLDVGQSYNGCLQSNRWARISIFYGLKRRMMNKIQGKKDKKEIEP